MIRFRLSARQAVPPGATAPGFCQSARRRDGRLRFRHDLLYPPPAPGGLRHRATAETRDRRPRRDRGVPRARRAAAVPPVVSDLRQDLAQSDSLPAAKLRVVTSFAGSASPWLAYGEEVLDVEIVHAVAPDAAPPDQTRAPLLRHRREARTPR